jgi:hypothetical protein
MDDTTLAATANAAQARLASDPKTAMSQFRIAKHALAYRCIDSNVDEAFGHLLDLARLRVEASRSTGGHLTPEAQNESILVALAAGAVTLAQELAAISTHTGDSHPFDVRLNAALRRRLGIEVAASVRYEPTPSEEPLFSAFEVSAPVDVSSYWRATRNRRYARTPFEKFDFFSAAIARMKKG